MLYVYISLHVIYEYMIFIFNIAFDQVNIVWEWFSCPWYMVVKYNWVVKDNQQGLELHAMTQLRTAQQVSVTPLLWGN